MADRNVTFIFQADTSNLTQGIQDVQGAFTGMDNAFGRTDKTLRALGARMVSLRPQTDKLKDGFSQAQEAIGAMGSAISTVNPELGQLLMETSAVVGGLKSLVVAFDVAGTAFATFGAGVIPLAVGVAALGAAMWTVAESMKMSKERAETLNTTLADLLETTTELQSIEAARALGVMADSFENLQLQVALAEGSMDKYDIATAKTAMTIKENAAAQMELVDAELATTKARKGELEAMKAAANIGELETINNEIEALNTEIRTRNERKTVIQSETNAMLAETSTLVARLRAAEENNKATSASTALIDENSIKLAKQAEDIEGAAKVEEARIGSLASAMKALTQVRESYAMKALKGEDLIAAREAEALSDLQARFDTAKELTTTDLKGRKAALVEFEVAKAAIQAEFDAQRVANAQAVQEQLDADVEEAKAKRLADIKQHANDAISSAQYVADAIGSISDNLFDARKGNLDALREYRRKNGEDMTKDEKRQLNARIKAEKKAMRKIAVAQKLAAIMDIGIKTAQGIMAVWAQFSAYPPVAAALSAVVSGAGLANQIAVASQQVEFHRGGVVDAKLLTGEAVLNRQATASLGPEGVDALNKGGTPNMGGSVTLRIGRHEAREIIRTDVRSGGMVTQEIGRIANTFGNAGVSGLPVLA